MASRRFIYVFLLPFLSFILFAGECSALNKSKNEITAACNTPSGIVSQQVLVNRLVNNIFDEAVPSVRAISNTSAQVPPREGGGATLYLDGVRKWFLKTAFQNGQPVLIAGEQDSFIPIALLLVFPKHWFW